MKFEENYELLLDVSKRLAANDGKPAISIKDAMNHFEITAAYLAETVELEIE